MLHFFLATWLIASAADGATSFLAASEGAREANPLFKSPDIVAAQKAAIGAVSVAAAHHWEHDHPRLIKVFAIAATVGYSALAVHNYQVYQEQRSYR
jgi:hypothetical protein